MSKNSSQNPLSDYSSRIKRIFIELNDYSFYHRPSDILKQDKRFIGRKKIRKKLETLLTNNETKSGAYLITGYRGMGKTSVVNKVLSEISGTNIFKIRATRLWRILLLLFLFSFTKPLSIGVPISIWFLALFYLIWTSPKRNDLKISKRSDDIISYVKLFFSFLHINDKKAKKFRFNNILHDVFLVTSLTIITVKFWEFYGKNVTLPIKFYSYLLLYLLLILVTFFVRNFKKYKFESPRQFFFRVREKINFSHRNVIRVNLGHDVLKEIDILKLITKKIHEQYPFSKQFSFFNIQKFFSRFLIYGVFYLIITLVYYYKPIYEMNLNSKKELGIVNYFPSQAIFYGSKDFNSLDNNIDKVYTEKFGFELNRTSNKTDSSFSIHRYFRCLHNDFLKKDFTKNFEINSENTNFPTLMKCCIYFDYFLNSSYVNIKKTLHPFSDDINGQLDEINDFRSFLLLKKTHDHYRLIPPLIDYYFLIYLFTILGLVRIISRNGFLGFPTHRKIKRRLARLIDRLNARITLDNTNGVSLPIYQKSSLNFLKRQTKSYPIADLREAEAELLSILEEIDRIPRFLARPAFIIIFDELDKIGSHQNLNIIAQKEAEDENIEHTGSSLFSTEVARKRQQAIERILANLKHFLNTAKAKFIFIAGREMYDASLADTSDRDSFIGSIFHEVFYVESFLKDTVSKEKTDVRSLVEHYVCQYILPQSYHSKGVNLKTYNEYLKNDFFIEHEELNKHELSLVKKKRKKIIFSLQNFITYLTYRSNGAPKKVTRLIENYILDANKEDLTNQDQYFVVGKNQRNLYLSFNYYDQYIFGMITSLTTPFLLGISRQIKDYGDKLLVSSSFLIDHLFKFNSFGFSWRNLELTPEIIDIHKAPELREFIARIIQYLTNTHIKEIVSGLYDFKFRSKISQEIALISKMSEPESAAFNFTLDESAEIKNHFKRQLKHQLNQYKNFPEYHKKYINSIGALYINLGDLHYYDQEYDEAIKNYRDASHMLEKENYKDEKDSKKQIFNFILIVRNMLKLGLAFEKRKSFDLAFLAYSDLTIKIIQFRQLLTSEFRDEGNVYTKNKKDGEEKEIHKEKIKRVSTIIENEYIEEIKKEKFLVININEGNEWKKKQGDLTFSWFKRYENFIDAVEQLPNYGNKQELYHKITIFEGIRMIYQPIIAKLHIVEKNNLGGVSNSDIIRSNHEFQFITKIIDWDEKFLLAAEYYNKIGDILFYKNGFLEKLRTKPNPENNPKTNQNVKTRQINKDQIERNTEVIYCHDKLYSLCNKNKYVTEKGKFEGLEDFKSPCSSCNLYFSSLYELCKNYFYVGNGNNILKELMDYINDETKINHTLSRKNIMRAMANTLSDIGDTFLSCATIKEEISIEFLTILLNAFLTKKNHNNLNEYVKSNINDLHKIEEMLCFYYLAYSFYLRVANHYESSFQAIKILYFFENYFSTHKNERHKLDKNLLKLIDKTIVRRAFLGIYRSYENTHRPEIEVFRDIFKGDIEETWLIYNNISVSSEFKEIIILFNRLRFLSEDCEFTYENLLISSYSTINNQYLRVNELRFKANLNYSFFQKLGFAELLKENISPSEIKFFFQADKILIKELFKKEISAEFAVKFLITDSIFCYHQMLRIHNLSGSSYMSNHSIAAFAYFQLAEWCFAYEQIKEFDELQKNEEQNIKEMMKSLISHTDETTLLDSAYNYEMAMQHFYSCLETHKESKAYRNIISNMFYLNDDFNDNLLHFYAAMERYIINSGTIRKKINDAKDILIKRTKLYDINRYIGDEDEEMDFAF